MGYDEAYELPTEEAVTLSLRTQQIVAHESGVTDTVDPLAGSYYIEWLTNELEQRSREVIADVDRLGGAVKAVEYGEPQRWIAEEAYRRERAVSDGSTVRVGVNRYVDEAGTTHEPRLFNLDAGIAERQVARTAAHLHARDGEAVRAALDAVKRSVTGDDNTMPALISAARAGATLGEMSDIMRSEFGEFREPSPW
jgi:methylmalonyl-CoA mutase N-terminal domain/subunit